MTDAKKTASSNGRRTSRKASSVAVRQADLTEDQLRSHIKSVLKRRREALQLTLRQLSKKIMEGPFKHSISPAYLNRIENGIRIPSVFELYVINRALDDPLGSIFNFRAQEPWFIVRASLSRKQLDVARQAADQGQIPDYVRADEAHEFMFTKGVYRYVPLEQSPEYVTPDESSGELSPHLRTLLFEVGGAESVLMNDPRALGSHEGEEVIFVLDGELQFWLQPAGQVRPTQHTLEPGDCLHFSSALKHGFRATGGKPARALFVYTRPPTAAVPALVKPKAEEESQ